MDFNDVFYYDETSFSCLRWKIDIWSGEEYRVIRIRAGDCAGTRHCIRGFRVIYQKKSYSVHRLIWEMHNGEIGDSLQIDHINQNSFDNRLTNMRLVTNTVNKRNSGMYSNNKTGVTGVRWITMNSGLYASATWNSISFKRCAAYYSVAKFGLLPAFQMAVIRRRKEIASLNEQGAMYSEIHGICNTKATQSL